MSPRDVALVLRWTKRLESYLERRRGARGRGLHEKVSSVEHDLPSQAVSDLRYVATIRNKLLHEEGFDRLDDRGEFRRRAERAARAIGMKPARRWRAVAAVLGAGVVAGGVWGLWAAFFR